MRGDTGRGPASHVTSDLSPRGRLAPGASRLIKPALFVLCLAPLAVMVFDALTGRLAAEPIKDLTHRTGIWGITLITATLAVTPLRRVTGWNRLQSFRRMLGLFAFTYLALHFLVYLVLDQFFDWHTIAKDIGKRPYITVGFTGLMLMVPLAVTSTRGWVRRLGKRWVSLHALLYVTALAGIVHFTWSQKKDITRPTRYAVVLVVLLGARLVPKGTFRSPGAGSAAAAPAAGGAVLLPDAPRDVRAPAPLVPGPWTG